QAATGLLVSGSTALHFFTRTFYGGDLDTYCQFSYSNTVGHWYLVHGYSFAPAEGQMNDFNADVNRVKAAIEEEPFVVAIPVETDIREYKLNNIAAVWNFKQGSQQIQLIATHMSPLHTIFSFHSTCVMNIFTHNAAYCLFPQLTLERKTTLLVDLEYPLTEIQMNAVKKYIDRGFDVLHQAPVSMTSHPLSALTFLHPRFIGD
ncbi:hypothetical protein F5051DRAFT_294997, partial [Lentinula edodes]